MKTNRVLMLVMLAIIFCCCTAEDDGNHKKMVPIERVDINLTHEQESFVIRGNSFAHNTFAELANREKGSFMISPLSIEYVLSIICNGAKGDTQAEILNVLGYSEEELDDLNKYYFYLANALYKVDNTMGFRLANALALNSCLSRFKDEFVGSVSTYYTAYFKAFDFEIENAEAVSTINSWAAGQTNGMIDNLLQELSPAATLVIMNAVWFKGAWSASLDFNTKNSKTDSFYKDDGSKEQIQYMNLTAIGEYAENEVFKSVRLPYGNGAFAMDVILPLPGKTVVSTCDYLTSKGMPRFYNIKVEMKIPKFGMDGEIQLKEVLEALGVKKIFTENADLSGMLCENNQVSGVFQHSNIRIDEEGTEAAAVTVAECMGGAVAGTPSPEVVKEFYATRPFVYLIRETSTGKVLFAGVFRGE